MPAENGQTGPRPEEIKAAQRAGWSRVARGWQRRWPVFERSTGLLNERLLDLGGVREGARVLDLGTGVGEPALSAARRTGPGGRVVAVDQAPGMAAIARERAAAEGLGHVEVLVADAESLPFGPGSFDVVLSRFGLMFLLDLSATLAALRGLLAPGGRLAAAVWAMEDRVPALRIPREAARRVLGLPPPDPREPGPFALSDEAELLRTIERAGFVEARAERVPCRFTYGSMNELRGFLEDTSSSLASLLENEAEDRRQEVWRAIEAEAAAYTDEAGGLDFPCEALLVTARKMGTGT